MFNKLFSLFGHIRCVSLSTAGIRGLLSILEEEFEEDQNAHDAGIDAICEILQAHKSSAQSVNKS